MNEKQKEILNRYLKNASIEEARELYDLLDKRESSSRPLAGGGINLNVDEMARNMSKQIQEQMGLANLNIKKMAVDMVVQMAKQHQPDISEKELAALVNEMVPGERSRSSSINVPPDLMKDMVEQFVAYSQGRFTEYERLAAPGGWAEKYWSVFPENIKKLITAKLTGIIDEDYFYDTLDYLLNKITHEPVSEKRNDSPKEESGKVKRPMPHPPGSRRNRG